MQSLRKAVRSLSARSRSAEQDRGRESDGEQEASGDGGKTSETDTLAETNDEDRQPVAASPGHSGEAAGNLTSGKKQSSAGGNPRSAKRLMKELQDMAKLKQTDITAELVEDNLFEWDVCLKQIDPDSSLQKDMRDQEIDCIRLRVNFPATYPFQPPFVRVVSPYIQGGYVMEGGAICMELLTTDGWSGLYTVEAVIRQFAASLVRGRARLARKSKGKAYTKENAEASFKALVKTHQKRGWYTPPKEDG